MILGGFYPGSYFPTGTPAVVATAAPASHPGGAWLSHTQGRYKGSKQRFEDGQFVDDDAMVEEVGAPTRPVVPSPNAPTFEPPKPWSPDEDEKDKDADLRGRERIEIPATPERKEPSPAKRVRAKRHDNSAALIVLLAAIIHTEST